MTAFKADYLFALQIRFSFSAEFRPSMMLSGCADVILEVQSIEGRLSMVP